MKVRKVQYTVKPEYIELNKKYIRAVMDYLQANPVEGMFYSTYQLPDSISFIHLCLAVDTETMGRLNAIGAFVDFKSALMASNPIVEPYVEELEFVGSNIDLFS